MIAVFADADKVEQCAAEYPRLSVAAYNGASTVLSGPGEDVERAAAAFSDAGIRSEWLQTSHAFHSALLDPVLDEFESYAGNVEYSPPQLAFVCNRTGEVLTRRSRLDAQYWRRHARQPVRFADSVATLAGLGCAVLMELGPQPVLTAAAMRVWPDAAPTPQTIASLRRETDDASLPDRGARGRVRVRTPAGLRRSVRSTEPAGRRTHLSVPAPHLLVPGVHRTRAEQPCASRSILVGRLRGRPTSCLRNPSRFRGSRREPPIGSSRKPPEQRLTRITDVIVTELADALRTSVDEIDPHAEFISLGMDSLTAMDLRRRLQVAMGTEIPASLFFAHPTVTALAEGLLAVWLDNSSDKEKRQIAIPRAARDGELPLSHAQEQLWFLHELLPSSSAYNVAARIDIPGPVDRHVLQRSFDAVMARHEVLRTTFRSVEGVPQAVLGTPQPFELPFEQVCDADVAAVAEREAAVPFDIAVGPLLRARLLGLGEQRHVLVLTMHHIVTDGWSFRVLLRDLGLIYQALERGEPMPLADLPIQYQDYAQWQRDRLRGTNFDAHLDFWRNDLAGAPPLELDTDRPRPKTPTFRGARTQFALGSERATALRGLCRAENVTVSVPLFAAFAAVLARYSGQDDVVVGTLTANRTRVETEDLIGLFVNALPVRIRLDGDPDGAELLTRIRQRMVDVLAHQDVPFDLIVNATAPDRDANRNPLFSVQLVVQPASRRRRTERPRRRGRRDRTRIRRSAISHSRSSTTTF